MQGEQGNDQLELVNLQSIAHFTLPIYQSAHCNLSSSASPWNPPCCSITINIRGARTVRKSALNVPHGGSPKKLLTALGLGPGQGPSLCPSSVSVSASLCHNRRGHNRRSVENQSKCDCKLWKWQPGQAGQAGELVSTRLVREGSLIGRRSVNALHDQPAS